MSWADEIVDAIRKSEPEKNGPEFIARMEALVAKYKPIWADDPRLAHLCK